MSRIGGAVLAGFRQPLRWRGSDRIFLKDGLAPCLSLAEVGGIQGLPANSEAVRHSLSPFSPTVATQAACALRGDRSWATAALRQTVRLCGKLNLCSRQGSAEPMFNK